MSPLAFTSDLKFGVAAIDRQHRRMVKIVNHLLRAVLHGILGAAEGMRTLKQDGIEKILLGQTDIDQIRSVCG